MAKKATGADAKAAAQPNGASLGKTLIAVVLMTALAAAGGALYAVKILPIAKGAALVASAKLGASKPAASLPSDTAVKDLPPIVTNIASPKQSWIRLEAAVVYDGKAVPHPDVLMHQISDDMLAFLRTVTLSEIQGAAGLRQLREDLDERIAIRSQGKARHLLIQALIVQ